MASSSKRAKLLLDLAVGRQRDEETPLQGTTKIKILSDVFISNAYDPTSTANQVSTVVKDLSPEDLEVSLISSYASRDQQHECPSLNSSPRILDILSGDYVLNETTGILEPAFYSMNESLITNMHLNEQTGLFELDEVPTLNYNETEPLDNFSDSSEIDDIPINRRANQALRVLGKKYNSRKVKKSTDNPEGFNNSTSVYEVHPERTLKEKPCNHSVFVSSDRSFLCGVITENIRMNIFKYFWSLDSWTAKRAYLKNLVRSRQFIKKRKDSASSFKNQAFDYYLPDDQNEMMRVCKKFLLNTLDLNADTLLEWIKKNSDDTENGEILTRHKIRSKHVALPQVPKVIKRQSVRDWLDLIPKVCSHYCRASSNRVYVEDTFESKAHMHVIYSIWCQDNGQPLAGRRLFYKELKAQKISIFKPRKDQCDVCVSYKMGNVSEETYRIHILKKDEARLAKQNAINMLVMSDVLVITMDVQGVLLCPKLLVSVQYYKQKLQLHNFSVYCNRDKKVHLYVWHEGNGGVSANEFTSCILDFLQKQGTYRKIVMISDGCAHQNRNKILASALANFSKISSIEIEQIILEKGHTMMEVDSVHSTLENKFKPPICGPTDYIDRMTQARPGNSYTVNYLDYSFFKNYEHNYESIRPGKKAGDPTVNDIRGLLYRNGDIYYKLRHPEDWQKLPQRARNNSCSLSPLYTEPRQIERSKFDHLQSLKEFISSDYHSFYDSLKHN